MPIYIYRGKKTDKIVEVFQNMNDEHIYKDENEEFDRVFQSPQIAQDIVKLDPFSKKDFVKKTGAVNKGSIGDLHDRSKELSEKRSQLAGGVDPVKIQFAKDYSAARKGKKLPVKSGDNYFDR